MDILDNRPLPEDRVYEQSTRPSRFEEFIGQERIKKNLKVFIQAVKQRGDVLEHVLLAGPPGLGKTTLAFIISKELGVGIKTATGPSLEKPFDLVGILTSLEEGDIFFIDEIHRLPRVVEEYLYTAMEDFAIDVVIDKGPGARSVRLSLPRFTLIGATTRMGLLSSPMLDRFGITFHLKYYSTEELEQIVLRSTRILNVEIDRQAAREIARRSRGTPRIANRLLRRVRDFAQVEGDGRITMDITLHALDSLGVDPLGLDEIDKRILRTIIEKFGGGPVGLKTLALAVSEDEGTIEEVYEPYLIRMGLIERTSRGRIATHLAYQHLGYRTPPRLL